ncbi:hypothetical protein OH77DRAFT_945101 [Trametes cingulata]|nr:hypothetical protein OH77DRAFT_945101 [Trametes cingulata]
MVLAVHAHTASTARGNMGTPADRYLQLRDICAYDYRLPSDKRESVPSPYSSMYADHYIAGLRQQAESGEDAPLRVEEALRLLSGVDNQGVPCVPGTLHVLDPIVNPTFEGASFEELINPLHVTPASYTVQAHSITAYAHYMKYMSNARELQAITARASQFPDVPKDRNSLEHLICAVQHAKYAAALQFISPAVLLAGYAFKTLALRVGVDPETFKHHRPLWRALERWEAHGADYIRQSLPVATLPRDVFHCTAVGCGSRAAQDHTPLVECTCGCDHAPSASPAVYCSRQCQDQDWIRHQAQDCPGLVPLVQPPATTMRARVSFASSRPGTELIHSLLEPQGPADFELHEVYTEDVDRGDPRNGKVLWEVESGLPSWDGTSSEGRTFAFVQYYDSFPFSPTLS